MTTRPLPPKPPVPPTPEMMKRMKVRKTLIGVTAFINMVLTILCFVIFYFIFATKKAPWELIGTYWLLNGIGYVMRSYL